MKILQPLPPSASTLFALVLMLSATPALADTGDQLAKLLDPDGAVNDYFGIAVATNGTIAIVGAINDDENGPDSGSAYILDVSTGL